MKLFENQADRPADGATFLRQQLQGNQPEPDPALQQARRAVAVQGTDARAVQKVDANYMRIDMLQAEVAKLQAKLAAVKAEAA